MGKLYRNKEWLQQRYEKDEWSQSAIAAFSGVTAMTIHKWMKKFGIPSRSPSDCHAGNKNGSWVESLVKDYHWLYRHYVTQKKPLREVAKEAGVSVRTVVRWTEHHGIKRRQGKEVVIRRRKGEDHPNWTGARICPLCGREKSAGAVKCRYCHYEFLRRHPEQNPNYNGLMDLNAVLRQFISTNWTPDVFKRDGYVCRECGWDKGKILEAHHIIPFSVLRDQLIVENPELDLATEDGRRKLVEIAKVDGRILDLDNGVTLCKECHKGEHRRIRAEIKGKLYFYSAIVLSVADGDTLDVEIDLGFNLLHRATVRLFGINTPELKAKSIVEKKRAIQAHNLVKTLCQPGRRVLIRSYKAGKYGRWLALLILDGMNLNDCLVDVGLAEEFYA